MHEIVVDKFLESPHFGERMAQNWFDLAIQVLLDTPLTEPEMYGPRTG